MQNTFDKAIYKHNCQIKDIPKVVDKYKFMGGVNTNDQMALLNVVWIIKEQSKKFTVNGPTTKGRKAVAVTSTPMK